jgi:glycerol transport system permease protein
LDDRGKLFTNMRRQRTRGAKMESKLLLLLPVTIVLVFVGIIPFFALINYSVQTPFSTGPNQFVGIAHFYELMSDSEFFNAITRTVEFMVSALVLEVLLGISLAVLYYEKGILNSLLSAVVVLPALFPLITIGATWRIMSATGEITTLLQDLGISFNPFQDPVQAFWSVVIMDVWHWTSIVFIVVSAGLAGMDKTPVLSARTEGATRFQIFRYVELPALSFPLVFVVLLRLITALKMFDEISVFTAGGPGKATEFVTQYIRYQGLEIFNIGYGSALSLFFLTIILLATYVLLLVMTRGRGLLQ